MNRWIGGNGRSLPPPYLSANASSPMLETHNLTRQFGKLTAVDALNIAVAPGEVFGLLGPNGAQEELAGRDR